VNRGLLSKTEGNYAAVFEDYSHSIAIKPTDADVYCHCGDALVGMGEYDRAFEDYEKALHLNPRHVMSFIGRGDLHKKVGDVRKAMKEYERCLEEVDANHFHAKKRLEECECLLLEEEEEFDGHLKVQRELIQLMEDREAMDARERMLRGQLDRMDVRRADELLEQRIKGKNEILAKVMSTCTCTRGTPSSLMIDGLKREAEELEKSVGMFEYFVKGGGMCKEKVLQSKLDGMFYSFSSSIIID
jgi:tetratricopeptide (TPR) repeat protein